MAMYDGEIRYTDAQIDRLFDKLKSLGIFDEALIIFTGDHGEEFMDHGGLSHEFTVFQEVIHVPLVIRFPEKYRPPFAPGSRMDRPVTLIDIGPTILDALDLPPYEGFEGISLLSRDMTEDEWQARMIFSKTDRHYCHTICVIREGMKYIHGYYPGDQYYQDKRHEGLYDLASDQKEKNNIIEQNEDLRKSMRGYIFDWVKSERKLNRIYASGKDPVVLDKKVRKHLESLGYIK
jgi:arylsulfatase A-like enzyme